MENQTQPNSPPIEQTPQNSISPPTDWTKISLFTLLGLITIAGSVFVGVKIGKNQTVDNQPIANPTVLPTATSPTNIPTSIPTAPNPTTEWQSYNNTAIGFSIKYPKDWRKVGTETSTEMIGFGPANVGEDVQWAINIYSGKTLDEIIADMGKQFGSDRKEQRKQITVNGLSATEAVVTTSSVQNWTYRQIIINTDNKLIAISNGAVEDDRFNTFYQSFSLNK